MRRLPLLLAAVIPLTGPVLVLSTSVKTLTNPRFVKHRCSNPFGCR